VKFENARQPLLGRMAFFYRQLNFLFYAVVILGGSLLIGTLGYAYFGQMSFIDGFYNASMILTGMGPVNMMTTTAGKLFSSLYALYSGVAFLTTVAVLLSPAIHRFLHTLHIEDTA
jgi:hypothetical protein